MIAQKLKLAIIGHGFVGKAVDYGFTHRNVEKYIIDPKYGTTMNNLPHDCDVAFVCVPTPMNDNAVILKSVVSELNNLAPRLIVIKSTITPDVIANFSYSGVVYNPEFLAEKNAMHDFVNPQFHVFGGDLSDTKYLEQVYNQYSLCNLCPTFHVSHTDASFIKYGINTFLATKVTFFNQLFDVVNNVDRANFASIIAAIGSDERIGSSHTKVPGFDGKQGFGGACFPKDCAALFNYDNRLTLLGESIRINNEYRSIYELDEREKEQNVKYHGQTKEELKDQTDRSVV